MTINPPILPPPVKVRKRGRTARFFGFLFATGMALFLAGSAVLAIVLWHFSSDLPNHKELAEYSPPVMSRIHAYDGRLIAEFAKQRRIYVPINTIPRHVLGAFLSAEDKNFFEHVGLDFRGIVRALYNHLVLGRRLTGASTITQQVAKNFFLSSDRSIRRKAREAMLSIRMERTFSKERILELYLNQIYLGNRSWGVAAASLNYFQKDLAELTIAEAAYLAALPKGPENYNPVRNPKRAVSRRNWVIGQMERNGFISHKEAEDARAKPLGAKMRQFGPHIFAAEFFAEEVRRFLVRTRGEKELYGGGLSVRTTLVPKLQRYAKKALVDGLVRYDRKFVGWRGPVNQVSIEGDWGTQLSEIKVYRDIAPWRLAVVLEAGPKQARIGLRPAVLRNKKVSPEREIGTIALAEVKWAVKRNKRGNQIGKTPRRVSDVLKPGDVIYVAPANAKPVNAKRKKKDDITALLEKRWSLVQLPQIEGAIVAMDPHTGRVLALVGGFSFDRSQFDRAIQAKRQPGSAFKPFVYAAALDNGYTPASVILDAPIVIKAEGQDPWKPQNYSGKYYGPSTLRLGIEKSRNAMTVRLAQDIGMPMIAEYASRFGIYKKLLPVLSMSLGAGETTLLQLTAGYSVFANGGKKVVPTLIDRIQSRTGATEFRHGGWVCEGCDARVWDGVTLPTLIDNRKQIIDPHTAYQITSMLEGVVKRGTGRVVSKLGIPLAGKTGTTNDEKDAWFIGFAPDLAVGVFMGYNTPRPMGRGATGGGIAAPVFRDFMKMALAGKPAKPFRRPAGIKLVRINRNTGVKAAAGEADAIWEAFKPNSEPPDWTATVGGSGSPDYWMPSDGSGGTVPGGLY